MPPKARAKANSEAAGAGAAPAAKRHRAGPEQGTAGAGVSCSIPREELSDLLRLNGIGSPNFSAYFFRGISKSLEDDFFATKWNIDRADPEVRCVRCGCPVIDHPSAAAIAAAAVGAAAAAAAAQPPEGWMFCADLHNAILAATAEKHSTADMTSLTLEGNFEWPTVNSSVLLERGPLVEALWAEAENALNGAKRGTALVVIGNPGIGKTSMLSCLLYYCLCAGNHKDALRFDRVVVDMPLLRRSWSFVVGNPGKSILTKNAPKADSLPEPAKGDKVLWLQDAGRLKPWLRQQEALNSVMTVVASSPHEANYSGVGDQVGATRRFVPTWTWEELEAARSLVPEWKAIVTKQELKKRLEAIGGLPRYCFGDEDRYEDYLFQLETAIWSLSFEGFASAQGLRGDTERAHKMLELVPTDNGRRYSLTFHNVAIERRWLHGRRVWEWTKYQELAKATPRHLMSLSSGGLALQQGDKSLPAAAGQCSEEEPAQHARGSAPPGGD